MAGGLLSRQVDGYQLGAHVMTFAHAYLKQSSLPQLFLSHLSTRQTLPQFTLNLSVLDGLECRLHDQPSGFAPARHRDPHGHAAAGLSCGNRARDPEHPLAPSTSTRSSRHFPRTKTHREGPRLAYRRSGSCWRRRHETATRSTTKKCARACSLTVLRCSGRMVPKRWRASLSRCAARTAPPPGFARRRWPRSGCWRKRCLASSAPLSDLRRERRSQTVRPPSTGNSTPLMNAAASLAR